MSKIPIFRLRTLLFTTVSKPIARLIIRASKKQPFIRTQLGNIGYFSDTVNYNIHKISRPESEKKIHDKEILVETGSEVCSEIMLLSILGYIFYGYYRKHKKESEELKNKINDIHNKLLRHN